jgi:putative ABC transport system permease protein
MEILPILSAMRRNKVGAILVAVQMAVTLAILCNALFIIEQRLASSSRPSGVDEANLFAISNQWIGNPPDEAALLQTDLAMLRALPGVVDAYATNSYPLTNSGWGDGASVKPDAPHGEVVHLARYFGDEHLLNTLGVRLVAGRNFTPDEIHDRGYSDHDPPNAVILTRAAAEALFPQGDALGKTIYTGGDKTKSAPIVGIVEKLQVPWVGSDSWASSWVDNSVIEPYRYLARNFHYMVRVQPGQLDQVIRNSQQKLFDVHRARVIDKVQTLTEARRTVYRDDRGLALILGVVCTVLLAVTAFGIVGLTSYWVAQRRRQIGIRRALGATRGAVVRYFQTENLMIAATGAVVGIGLAITLNLWMVSNYQLQRLGGVYTVVGAVAVLLLGQAAVLWPALRAASIPPALATRSV